MIRSSFTAAAMLAVALAMPARAADVTAGNLKITAPWARATPKGASVGGGYLKITNTGTVPDRLVGGSSDISRRVEFHSMSMEKGVMKMRPVTGGLEIKPGQTVEFKPGGYHLMFVGLKRPLVRGEHLKATLEFAKAGKVNVDFAIEGIGAMHGGDAPHGMHDMPMKH